MTDTQDQTETEDPNTQTETVEEQQTGDTFPREYVEKLRQEAGDHRTAAKAATEALEPLQQRLHALLVAGSGRLADPSDLPFDAAHLDDEDALTTALDDLLARKPHLATRRVAGDVGQGAGTPKTGFSLAGLLASSA